MLVYNESENAVYVRLRFVREEIGDFREGDQLSQQLHNSSNAGAKVVGYGFQGPPQNCKDTRKLGFQSFNKDVGNRNQALCCDRADIIIRIT